MQMRYRWLLAAVLFSRLGGAVDMCAAGKARAQGIPIVLIVEDEEHVSAIVAANMRLRGYHPVMAKTIADAEDAMAILGNVALAMIDVNLKGEDGIILAARFRSDRLIPCILMSGEFTGTQAVSGYDTLPKPINQEELTTVLARALTPP